MSKVDEFIRSCHELEEPFRVLEPNASLVFLSTALERFKPVKQSAHLAIGGDSVSIPLEPNEFSYSAYLKAQPIYIFFEQSGNDKNRVIVLENGNSLGKVFANVFGMEYFACDERQTYLLAVNWYVIEGVGAVDWMRKLAE